MKKQFKSNGKLLLTGEYFVLDGAKALALPTKQGQTLSVLNEYSFGANLYWKSLDADGECWFEGEFQLPTGGYIKGTDDKVGMRLEEVLMQAKKQNPNFLVEESGLIVTAQLEFPRLWGFGSSSTLLHLISQWAEIDAFELSDNTFGGSGYDIACAGAKQAIFYKKENGSVNIKTVDWNLPFSHQLYFVYLNQKQNSRSGIARYREKAKSITDKIAHISELADTFLNAHNIYLLESLIVEHEQIVAETIELPRAKALYFSDFWGEIKSLGAWGGDFVLATSDRSKEETIQYFNTKSYEVVLSLEDIVQV